MDTPPTIAPQIVSKKRKAAEEKKPARPAKRSKKEEEPLAEDPMVVDNVAAYHGTNPILASVDLVVDVGPLYNALVAFTNLVKTSPHKKTFEEAHASIVTVLAGDDTSKAVQLWASKNKDFFFALRHVTQAIFVSKNVAPVEQPKKKKSIMMDEDDFDSIFGTVAEPPKIESRPVPMQSNKSLKALLSVLDVTLSKSTALRGGPILGEFQKKVHEEGMTNVTDAFLSEILAEKGKEDAPTMCANYCAAFAALFVV